MKTLSRSSFLVFLFLLQSFVGFAYPIIPLVSCFEKSTYNAGRQNWAIATDSQNTIYFGNNDGLLHYAFGEWELKKTDKNDQIRSLKIQNDTIWAAGDLEFGFFTRSPQGALHYTHLADIVGGQGWKIEIADGKVYYQTQENIYAYDKKSKDITALDHQNGFYNITKWGNQIWGISRDQRLGYVNGNTFEEVADLSVFGKESISAMFVHRNKIYALVAPNDFVVYDGRQAPQLLGIAENLRNVSFFSAQPYDDENIALGSISNGLLLYNDQQQTVNFTVDESHGLIENTVLSIANANDGKLWLGLDYGIACVESQTALSPIFNKGATYDILTHNGITYLATNKGLFSSSGNEPFRLVPRSQGQNWKLVAHKNKVFVCHNNGVFRVEGRQFEPVFRQAGILDFVNFEGTDYFVVSAYTGLFFGKFSGEKFELFQNLNYWGNPKIAYDKHRRCIWAKKPKGGDLVAYRLNEKKELYAESHKGIVDFFVNGDDFLFYDGQRLRELQQGGFELIRSKPFKLIKGEGITQLAVSDKAGKVAFVQNGKVDLLVNLPNGNYFSFQELFRTVQRHLVKDSELIDFHEGILRIGTDRGVEIFDADFRSQKKLSDKTVISKINAAYSGDKNIGIIYPFRLREIDFERNLKRLSFSFGSVHGLRDFVEYRYQLLPDEQQWSEWSTKTTTEFHNLKGGNYSFKLQTRINGVVGSEETVQFTIKKNFTQTKTWKVLLLLVFLLFTAFVIYFITRRYKKEYHKKTEAHKEQYAEKEIQLKNEQLVKYLEVINEKNAILREVKEDLADVRNKLVQHTIRKIEMAMESERKDYIFDKLFSELHHDFLVRLEERFPDLTTTEIRLISLIRFNLKNDEIANLMQITPKSVAVNRYRLRKKIGIEHDQDLDHFIRGV